MSVAYQTKTLKLGSAEIIIHRPVLSPPEYKKQEENVRTALEVYARMRSLQSVNK